MPGLRPQAKYDIVAEDRSKAAWDQAIARSKKASSEIAGVLRGAFLGVGIGAIVTDVIRLGDAAGEAAQRLRIPVEELTRLQFAAERGSLSGEQLVKVLEDTARAVQEAAAGNQKYADSFADLGLDADALVQMRLDQQFDAIAKAIANSNDQVRLARRIFGDAGVGVLEFAGDLDALKARSDEVGATMSASFAQAASDISDAMQDARAGVESFFRFVVTEGVNAAQALGSAFAAAVSGPGGILDEDKIREQIAVLEGQLQQLVASGIPADQLLQTPDFQRITSELEVLRKQLVTLANLGPVKVDVDLPDLAGDGDEESARERRAREALERRAEAEREALARQIEALRDSTLEKEELEAVQLARSVEKVQEAVQAKVLTEAEGNELIRALVLDLAEERRKAAEQEIADFKEAQQEKLQALRELTETEQEREFRLLGEHLRTLDELNVSDQERARLRERLEQETFRRIEELNDRGLQNQQDGVTRLANFINVNLFTLWRSGTEGMREQFANVLAQMAADFAASGLTQLFRSLFPKKIEDAMLGGIDGGVIGEAPRFAAAGGVFDPGEAAIVGEHGRPELVLFGRGGGRVVPEHKIASGPQVTIVNNNDFRGADASLLSRLPKLLDQRDRVLMNKVAELIRG